MNYFITSDWHIGHKNVLEYSKRPFRDLNHMHEVLINNYNASVGRLDTCFFAGDIGWPGPEMERVISQLSGNKILILGNHDKAGMQFYNKLFSLVVYGLTLYKFHETITISHCPLLGVKREDITNMKGAKSGENWHGESRHQRYSMPNFGQFHLHGHVHSPNGGKSQKLLGKQMDIGVDANKYRPVSFREIESWIAKYKKGINETK